MSDKHPLPSACEQLQEKIAMQHAIYTQAVKAAASSSGPAASSQPTSMRLNTTPPDLGRAAVFYTHSKVAQGQQQSAPSSRPGIAQPVTKVVPKEPKVAQKPSTDPDPEPRKVIKKPRSPYNLFYLVERQLIMDKLDPTTSQLGKHISFMDDAIPHPELPARYRGAGIANPLIVISTERRKHRKVHGKIGFVQLCRAIADRWKKADSATKLYFKCLSRADFVRFRTEYAKFPVRIEDSQQQPKKSKKSSKDTRANAKGHPGPAPWEKATEALQALTGNCESTIKATSHPPFLVRNQNTEGSWKRKSMELSVQGGAHVTSFGGRKRSKTEIDIARSLVSGKMFMPASVKPSSITDESPTASILGQKRSEAEIDVAHSLVSSKMLVPVPEEPQKQESKQVPCDEGNIALLESPLPGELQKEGPEPDTVISSSNEEKVSSKKNEKNEPAILSNEGNSASLQSLLNTIRSKNKQEITCIPPSGDSSTSPPAKVSDQIPDHNGSQGIDFTSRLPMTPTPVLSGQFNHLGAPVGGVPIPSIPPGTFHPALISTISSFELPWDRQLDLYRVYLQTLFEHQIKNNK